MPALYIPHGSDERNLNPDAPPPEEHFISHMVQMKAYIDVITLEL